MWLKLNSRPISDPMENITAYVKSFNGGENPYCVILSYDIV
jgi:hypothetical protein